MPVLGTETEVSPIKMLVLAYSGFGKTGALASLAAAGFQIKIVDLDNGVEVLLGFLEKKFQSNVEYKTFTDQFFMSNQKFIPSSATAWVQSMAQLDTWIKTNNNPKTVIVIDSLTMLSEACMRHVLFINKRLGQQPYQSDWGEAQRLLVDMLGMLYSKSVKCNIIVNTHIVYQGGPNPNAKPEDAPTAGESQPIKGLPSSIGKAISSVIPRFFNTMLVGKVLGEGPTAQRLFFAAPVDLIDAKSSVPLQGTYPIRTGLASIFAALRPSPPSQEMGSNPKET